MWGRERFSPKYFFFSVCFYLVLPPPSREGVQCNRFAHIMASDGLFLLVFDWCHLFTNGINCLSAPSTEPEQIQNNLGVSFPGLAVELWLAFATWFAFCQTSCLHDQLTCFTDIFLAKTYKLAFFIFGKGFLKKQPKVLFCFGLLCHASLMAQGACRVLFCCLPLSPIITGNPAAHPVFPAHWCPFSALLPLQHPPLGSWRVETALRNISQPCGLLNTVRKQQHLSCLCRRPKCAIVLDFGIFSSSCRAFTAEFIFKRSK